jgi:alpha-L-rhamnosidase
MFTGINASLYTRLGGIEPTGPGYETLTIAPKVPAGHGRNSVTAADSATYAIGSGHWHFTTHL